MLAEKVTLPGAGWANRSNDYIEDYTNHVHRGPWKSSSPDET